FQARYVEEHRLGEGGCGAVFAGYRIKDHLPVSVQMVVVRQAVTQIRDNIVMETSAPVSLLEWFDFGRELILVMERPVPAVDLDKYIEENGGFLPEDKAKVILKQLVDAAKHLEDKHIFHRDIKSENILIETGSDVPRVRIIDFGLSCFVKEQSQYRVFYGTEIYSPPEWYGRSCYRCGPTTVWQMGVVLYEALHAGDFNTTSFLKKRLKFKRHLSKNCRDFLDACLTKVPETRPTLEELQHHTWETLSSNASSTADKDTGLAQLPPTFPVHARQNMQF
uniref:Serine/threonine-protein kinase n=1 Tax=Maylandia zebra TaxID=106582 RepID=A0A3P9C2Q5_9CICH